jgi:hypothetical protein
MRCDPFQQCHDVVRPFLVREVTQPAQRYHFSPRL